MNSSEKIEIPTTYDPIDSEGTNIDFFSFVVPKKMAGMRYPKDLTLKDILHLKENNIFGIVSLTSYKFFDKKIEIMKNEGVEYLHLPIDDGGVPTFSDVENFLEFAEKLNICGKGVVVHCRSGVGRTGTMLACFLLSKKVGTGEECIDLIRGCRTSCSIEHEKQEQFIKEYYCKINKKEYKIDVNDTCFDGFSFVIPNLLAGMKYPRRMTQIDINFLKQNNIHGIVNLLEWDYKKYFLLMLKTAEIKYINIPIKDRKAPTFDDVQKFFDFVDDLNDQKKGVVVNCYGGHGRTGTMLAAYIMNKQNLPAKEVIEMVRKMRKSSIESKEQEEFLEKLEKIIKK